MGEEPEGSFKFPRRDIRIGAPAFFTADRPGADVRGKQFRGASLPAPASAQVRGSGGNDARRSKFAASVVL